MAIGEDAYQSGEGRSFTDIGFKGLQMELLDAIYKVNKKIVIVLMNGRPTELVPSILECWHLGSQSGYAIADIHFGDYNPSGKLPVSFPHNVGQQPLYYNQKNTGRPSNSNRVTYSHYRDVPKTALYPFAFGLSYIEFSYSDLKLNKTEIPKDGELQVSVTLTNSGD